MKLYCYKCQRLFEDRTKCPDCRFTRLREVQENDPVLLTKANYMQAEMLKALLEDAGIPFLYKGGMAPAFAMNVGMNLDVIRFYVPFSALEKANELVMVLETSAPEETEETPQNE